MNRLMQWIRGAVAALVVLGGDAVQAVGQGQEGFVPAGQVAKETLPALPLVYAAYGFVWLALVVYIFLLWRRLGRVERDLADVAARVRHGK